MSWKRPQPQSREERVAARSQRLGELVSTRLATAAEGRAVVYGGSTRGPRPKECVLESAAYENAVRDLGFCVRCRRKCRPQFCHRDEGKGAHIKTDVREGWAGCGPGPWGHGCHYFVGTSGTLTKEQRRAEDLRLGRITRALVRRRGLWPKSVPDWSES